VREATATTVRGAVFFLLSFPKFYYQATELLSYL
jgi:hypothetical protein